MRRIETWVSSDVPAARLTRIETPDQASSGPFRLEVEFAAPAYAQSMQGRMLVFRPGVLSQRGVVSLTQPKRRYPIALHARNYSDTFRVEFPPGFKVEELPDSGKLESPYGTFKMTVKSEGGAILVTRSLELKRITVPADNYAQVRKFFSTIAGAESAPVVLAKSETQ